MFTMDKIAHSTHSMLIDFPTTTLNKDSFCECGTLLDVMYHEDRLYSVRCINCEKVILVKANNYIEATEQF